MLSNKTLFHFFNDALPTTTYSFHIPRVKNLLNNIITGTTFIKMDTIWYICSSFNFFVLTEKIWINLVTHVPTCESLLICLYSEAYCMQGENDAWWKVCSYKTQALTERIRSRWAIKLFRNIKKISNVLCFSSPLRWQILMDFPSYWFIFLLHRGKNQHSVLCKKGKIIFSFNLHQQKLYIIENNYSLHACVIREIYKLLFEKCISMQCVYV